MIADSAAKTARPSANRSTAPRVSASGRSSSIAPSLVRTRISATPASRRTASRTESPSSAIDSTWPASAVALIGVIVHDPDRQTATSLNCGLNTATLLPSRENPNTAPPASWISARPRACTEGVRRCPARGAAMRGQRSGVENPHVVVYSDRAELNRASGGISGHAGPIHDKVGRQTPHLEEHPVTAERHADARLEQLGLEAWRRRTPQSVREFSLRGSDDNCWLADRGGRSWGIAGRRGRRGPAAHRNGCESAAGCSRRNQANHQ